MKPVRLAIIGCGFWSHFQISAWKEIGGVEIFAVGDINPEKAKTTAATFGIPAYYSDPAKLLENEEIQLVDVITSPETHKDLVELVSSYGKPVICQKPMATNYEDARQMVEKCRARNVGLFVHENFRWQAPARRVKELLESRIIGKVFKSRIAFCNAFPVFAKQPFLATLEQFIITDVGSHLLDMARFLLGEVRELYCATQRVNSSIKGEDVATILLKMVDGSHCLVELSYASHLEHQVFPQTLMTIEGEHGVIELGPAFQLSVTHSGKTSSEVLGIPMYSWVDPKYAVVQSSMVPCNQNLLDGFLGRQPAETTGADNLKTLELVFQSYRSAETGKPIQITMESL